MMVNETSKRLKLSADGVRYLERIGRLPAMRTTSGVRLFFREDVERLRLERLEGKSKGCHAHP
jgi:DNA-binding transcriptional MerR regulator